MNEIKNTLRLAAAAMNAVRVIDITKKLVIAGAAVGCGIFAVRFFRK
ncbi:MAG: hypothetical protein IJE48_01665 [Clostridia bacterium]|nr:hypothetical protein [Clostridia bacterium]